MNPTTRICKVCGDEFVTTSPRQVCCNKTIVKRCEVCGTEFETICNSSKLKTTCSPKCTAVLIKQRRKESAQKTTKICKWCGKDFHPKSLRDEYCYDTHYATCEVCGKQFEINVRKDKTIRTCSSECKKVLQLRNRDLDVERKHFLETMQSKYGVDNPMKLQEVQEKLKETNRNKYGADWYTQTDEYKEKVKETDLKKYGCEHHLQSQKVINKRKETCLEKYGVDNVAKSDEVKSTIRNKMLEKYGVINFSQTQIENFEEWEKFKSDPAKYISNTFGTATCSQIASHIGCSLNSVYDYLDDESLKFIIKSKSRMEDEVYEFLRSLDSDMIIKLYSRSFINPYGVDLYLPEYKLAIECNPTETHNSSIPDIWGGYPKPKIYHKMNTDMCEKAGINLIHLFGYEWKHKKEILKSILRNALKKNTRKIYARNTILKAVSFDESQKFLIQNHRQGVSVSKIRLGLYYDEELVSLITFNSTRYQKSNIDEYELIRFCSKLNTTVVGGASKLFKEFLKIYQPHKVISYSDRAHTEGTLYEILGFKLQSISDPGYVWVDPKTDEYLNRIKTQKHKLKNLLNDDSIDLSKTEKQIMEEHGFVQIFDSGVCTWVYQS